LPEELIQRLQHAAHVGEAFLGQLTDLPLQGLEERLDVESPGRFLFHALQASDQIADALYAPLAAQGQPLLE
jgi:hypothetical protein